MHGRRDRAYGKPRPGLGISTGLPVSPPAMAMWSGMNPADNHPDSWRLLTLDLYSKRDTRRQLLGKISRGEELLRDRRLRNTEEQNSGWLTPTQHATHSHTHTHTRARALVSANLQPQMASPCPTSWPRDCSILPACRFPFVSRLLSMWKTIYQWSFS